MQTNFTTAQLRDPQIQAAHRAVVKILLRDGTDKGQVFAARRPSPRNGSDLNRIMRALRRLKKYRAPRKGVVELCGRTDLYSQQDRLRRLHCIARPDCLADDAVNCEPVSASKFLLTGKLTGNFAEIQPSNRGLRV